MLLKQTTYTSDTYIILVTIKDFPYQCLVEVIHQVHYIRYLLNHYITPLYYFTNQVVLSLNVLTLLVVSWLFRLCHYPIIVTKQCHRLYSQEYKHKSHEELPKLNNFLYYLRSCNKLDFYNEVNRNYNILNFIVESIIQDCFILLKIIATSPKVNTKLEVGQQESLFD